MYPTEKTCPMCGISFERNGRHLTNWKRTIYCSKECSVGKRKLSIDEDRVIEMFNCGHTAKEISYRLQCSTSPVNKILKKYNLKRKPAPRPGVAAGEKNSQWKGGRRKRKDGYIVVWTESGEILEHRHIIEQSIGRKLKETEIVHHKDGNKSNNALDNLEVTDKSAHISEHRETMTSASVGVPNHGRWRKTITLDGIVLYHCSACDTFKRYMEFHKESRTIIGIKYMCKECSSKKEKERWKNRK